MATPTISRTWQFKVNQLLVAQANSNINKQNIFFQIKESLIGNGSWTDSIANATISAGNWIVVGSSDGSASSLDGTDRITSGPDFIFGAGAHSWIVLRQTGISSNFEICIDGESPELIVTNTGFGAANGGTDGSVTTRPTATFEIPITNFVQDNSDTGENYMLHVSKTEDGLATRIFVSSGNQTRSVVLLEKVSGFVPGWSDPFFVGAYSSSSSLAQKIITYDNIAGASTFYGSHSGLMNLQLTSEATSDVLVGKNLVIGGVFDGSVSLFPIGIASFDVGKRGRHGTVADLWFGNEALADGTTYPSDGSKQFVQMGVFVVPWNTTGPLFSG